MRSVNMPLIGEIRTSGRGLEVVGVELIISIDILAHDRNQIDPFRNVYPFTSVKKYHGEPILINEHLNLAVVSVVIKNPLVKGERLPDFNGQIAQLFS